MRSTDAHFAVLNYSFVEDSPCPPGMGPSFRFLHMLKLLIKEVLRRIVMIPPFYIQDEMLRGTFLEAHIADLHFGAMDPKIQYEILKEQFISKIENLPLSIISVNGDLYDHRFLANQDAITYANMFIADLVKICELKGATLIILHGTESHDAYQLSSLYHYLYSGNVDIRIVEKACFQYVKGKTILCLPEEYGKGEKYYKDLLMSRHYDACYMHGTFVGGIYGKNKEDLDSTREPVFSIENFARCEGPIIAGHVHVAQCIKSHMYYCGSPYRWKFGEEQPKGFFVLLHNLDTKEYYNHFEQITSFRYDTIDLDSILLSDPNEVVKYIDNLKVQGIDHLKIKVRKYTEVVPLIKEHYRNKNWIKIEDNVKQDEIMKVNDEVLQKYADMEFLTDPSLSEYQKFVMYVNHFEGEGFVTLEELMDILNE